MCVGVRNYSRKRPSAVADPGKSIRRGANFEIFSFRGGGGVSSRFTTSINLSFQNLIFNKGGRAPAAPLYKSATASGLQYPQIVRFKVPFVYGLSITMLLQLHFYINSLGFNRGQTLL